MMADKDVVKDVISAIEYVLKIMKEAQNNTSLVFTQKVQINTPYEELMMQAVMQALAMGTTAHVIMNLKEAGKLEQIQKEAKDGCDGKCDDCETGDKIEELLHINPQRKKENNLYT